MAAFYKWDPKVIGDLTLEEAIGWFPTADARMMARL